MTAPITFKYARDQHVEARANDAARYRPATIASRIPCDPVPLYHVQWADGGACVSETDIRVKGKS